MSRDTETGYVIDTEYTRHVFREMLPFHLAHICALRGVSSRLAESKAWSICELGCGPGLNSLMMAAAQPEATVLGVDMNPAHIASASALAAKAGLTNARFIEATFSDLLQRDLPDFDLITLHGVYSWIAPEHRAQVVDLITRKLKPGGVVYVSYNALPGWASMAPIRQLMVDTTAHLKLSSTEKANQVLVFLKELAGLKGRFFQDHPRVLPMLEKLSKMDARYLAHEYLNAEWHPQYSAEVASEMARARLSWVGDAELAGNYPDFWLSAEMKSFLAKAANPIQRETWKDFLLNTQFRRDVFVKGRQEGSPVAQEALLAPFRYGAFDQTTLPESLKVGAVSITPGKEMKQVFAWVVEAPRSQADLFALGQAAGITPALVRSALYALLSSGKLSPCQCEQYGKRGSGRLSMPLPANQAFLDDAQLRGGEGVLLSPLTQSSLATLPFVQVLMLSGLLQGLERPALVVEVQNWLARHRLTLNDDQQQAVNDPAVLATLLANRIEEFELNVLPRLIRSGIIV